ncbi:MAG: phytoene desaturase family protein [Planctomycetota bacterium]|jgi:phytoene desaturase
MRKKIVIVGAGPGGLASAMLLAKAGAEVTVVERNTFVGGRTSTFEQDGYKFDLGPTFFLYPRILEEIFATTGADLHDHVDLRKLDPQYRIAFGAGGHIDATPDVERLAAEIARLSPGDGPNVAKFLDANRHKFEAFKPCLEQPYLGWRDIFTKRMAKLLPVIAPWRSLDKELARYFSDPRIRLAFSFQSKYLGMSPFRCPSVFSFLSYLEYEYGVFHPMGGCGAVSTAMAERAAALGVDIRLGEAVEEVLVEGRRATGVRTAAGVHRADAVFMNADFAHAMRHLVPDRVRRRWSDKQIAKKQFSCSTFMLYLGVEGNVDLPHHTIHIAEDYNRNLDEIEKQHVLSDDPSFYVQNASVTDPSLAPAGDSALYVLVPTTHQHPNVDWGVERSRYRDLTLRQLAKVGLHDIASRIRTERIVTPAEWEHAYAIHQGATFNLKHTLGQMLHLRPRNRFEDLDGVYLTGGGTHPGSGLPVIYESARISTRLACDDLGLAYPAPAPVNRRRRVAALQGVA